MATFDEAIPVVMEHEGVYSNLRGDPGGETMFGWSSAECARLGIPQPHTAAEAIVLYRRYFWNLLYEGIESQTVATKLFDDGVNQGTGEAVTNLQEALCRVGSIVRVDGEFGPNTLRAVNLVTESMLLPWMRIKQFLSYERWIQADSTREYLRKGLASRAAWPDPDGSIAKMWLDGFPQGV